MKPTLFDSVRLGAFELKNRFVMSALTRCRASEGRVPNALMAEYYAQRVSAGLILSEATSINPMGVGYPSTPGIWNEAQITGWKLVTDAVHAKDGLILAQLWHVGRVSDPIYLDGQKPVAPSAVKPAGHVSLIRPKKEYETPRALTLAEIESTLEDFRIAAENAKKAGFDGVEIHGANSYLPEQFLHSSSNHRTDEYGGSIENRARFMLGTIDAALKSWPADRIGLHLSPQGDAMDTGDATPVETYAYLAQECKKRGLAFLFSRESLDYGDKRITPVLREHFGHGIIANQGLNLELGEKLLREGEADAIAFGQDFISNPDLPERLRQGAELNPPRHELFYASDAEGYTDYPFLG